MKTLQFSDEEAQTLGAILDATLRAQGLPAVEAVFAWHMKLKTAPSVPEPPTLPEPTG